MEAMSLASMIKKTGCPLMTLAEDTTLIMAVELHGLTIENR